MSATDNVPDAVDLCLAGDFHSQVQQLLQQVRLSRQEVEDLSRLFEDLQYELNNIWPGIQIVPFGSVITGMGIKTSDVDCYAQLPNGMPCLPQFVLRARNALRRIPHIFTDLLAITTARVPILKFLHIPTNCYCDLNFKSPSGVRNSKLIAYLLGMDRRAFQLAIIIKYWSKVHKITGTNLMPNYALTLMVIFYLQQRGILPTVAQLQMNVSPNMLDCWDTCFNENFVHKSTNTESLYILTGGFFMFYDNFNFGDHIISPYLGYPIARSQLQSTMGLSLYHMNVEYKKCKPIMLANELCVQDPFELNRNCTVGVHSRLLFKIVSLFRYSASAYENDGDGFLIQALSRQLQIQMPQKIKPKFITKNKITKKPKNNGLTNSRRGIEFVRQNIKVHTTGKV